MQHVRLPFIPGRAKLLAMEKGPSHLSQIDDAVQFVFNRTQGPIRLGTPLGLGKPNIFLNALYEHAKKEPTRRFELYTALSLTPPPAKGLLAERFYLPFLDRHFGPHYPKLQYVTDLLNKKVPAHVHIHEFYLQAGVLKNNPQTQQNYISLNYTHAAQSLLDRGLNVIVQLVSRGANGKLSLSCNPDLTLDLKDLAKERKVPLLLVGVIHPDLPYLGGDAEVDESFFDAVLESEGTHYELFALPRLPIDPASHLIGLHASQLLEDDGTLQIGIGSLSEALTHSLLLRQKENNFYKEALKNFNPERPAPSLSWTEVFKKGLYGTSEMVMDGFMHLRKAGILSRTVIDKNTKASHYLHGSFFLGSKDLYAWLRGLRDQDYHGLGMTRISKVNDLYDPDEMSLRRQRKNARFVNTCMQMSLYGGAISDTLENGTVISGVGGQYNFVAMAHELSDARSLLLLKSTRNEKGHTKSNIILSGGHVTIARHLRDVVITEYGVAELRGKSDQECIIALLNITDSEFQEELMNAAKAQGKLSHGYQIPEFAKNNTPAHINHFLQHQKEKNAQAFSSYPFGSDFTPAEKNLVRALEKLQSSSPSQILKTFAHGLGINPAKFQSEMQRMNLERARSIQEKFFRRLLLGGLCKAKAS